MDYTVKAWGRAIGLLCAFPWFTSWSASASDAESWRFEREKDGVKLYTRTVENSEIRAYRAVTTLRGTVAKARALLDDVEGYVRWIPSLTESRVVSGHGTANRLQYFVLDAPFPVSSRDGIVRFVITEDPKTGVLTVDEKEEPDAQPLRKGHVRIPRLRCTWRFEPRADGHLDVETTSHTEPGGSLPRWLVNKAILESPFELIANMRKLVEGL